MRDRFEFWEDWDGYASALKEVAATAAENQEIVQTGKETARDMTAYTVKKGDTLWGIAKRYDVTLSALIAANPQIKNPNLIYPGNQVNIP